MSQIQPVLMYHHFRCVICQRLIGVVLALHESPIRALEEMGANLDGPDSQGLVNVQGCADCLRYTTRTRTTTPDDGGR
jgi:hypothetical protein